ncbi:electron transfer flavoprotein subunit beta [Niallia taxi]|uniref:electron transfer flavoprotein subunit beta/FixA family protein n=1 Tax=Niallia taxi TaxID=2499688 RepID=UPI0011A52AFA|nr:electron transfer flavoprotein subunit beta [Niallia taxi]WOD64110.1 electron transfer flavoprotein subunit beta [Niallia taxi]
MNIIVLLSIVVEANQPITIENGQILDKNIKEAINPPDEAALEEALLLKETYGGSITIVAVHHQDAEKHLRRALAMGADSALLIQTEGSLEPSSIAKIIAQNIKDLSFDLILAGDFSTNGGSGQVGPRVAAILELPIITKAERIELDKGAVFVTKESNGDLETYKGSFPVLLTIPQGLHKPRLPILANIMRAKQKPLEKRTASLEQIDIQSHSFRFPVADRKRIILQGELPEQVSELAKLIKEHIQE